MTACTTCGVEFVLSPGKAKRRDYRCQSCDRKYKAQWYRSNPDSQRVSSRKYRQRPEIKNKGRLRSAQRRVAKAESHKWQARALLRAAVSQNKLTRLPCEVCGDRKSHGHHDDYSKPFDVRWFCVIHHARLHAKIKAALSG